MKKGEILENIKVEKLIFGGKGLAIGPDGKKIIITGGAIPGSFVNLRILKSKSKYLEAQVLDIIKKSPLEKELPAHFQVYGGCKWLPIDYSEQLKIKEEQVKEALFHLKDFTKNTKFHPIVASEKIYGYRNKLEFSWGKYISAKEEIHDDFRFGFHKQGEFDRIINCEYCVLASDIVNDIFKEVNTYSRNSKIPTYDPFNGIGFWRHLVVREAHYTGEIMLIFSVNNKALTPTLSQGEREKFMINFLDFIKKLVIKFPNIKSVYYLKNNGKADIVQGEYELIFGEKTIKEKLLDFTFEINPRSFFQTNSTQAEVLYSKVINLIPSPSPQMEKGDGEIEYVKVPGYIYELARELRKDGTNMEKILWEMIKNRQVGNLKFRRQHPIGRYIADFYCPELGLVIELDGDIHDKETQIEYDKIRDEFLKSGNYKILRMKNEYLLKNPELVIKKILSYKFNSPLHSMERGWGGGVMLDLYAGTGTIGIILSKYFKKVYSVELVKEASIDGQNNAKLNNVENVEFINEKTEDFLKEFSQKNEKVDLLVIDPPRDGMHPEALPNIISFDAKTIIYVSCNPSTLARDLDYIVKNSSYEIADVIPVDMFPHTHHIETIVKLSLT
ncbi:DUF559 domain-containing protein [Candidatus Gracilibacteria bacterium]|nr:DUF559 domain-containing protein [Candidatus Gracilibacteria bacterium]